MLAWNSNEPMKSACLRTALGLLEGYVNTINDHRNDRSNVTTSWNGAALSYCCKLGGHRSRRLMEGAPEDSDRVRRPSACEQWWTAPRDLASPERGSDRRMVDVAGHRVVENNHRITDATGWTASAHANTKPKQLVGTRAVPRSPTSVYDGGPRQNKIITRPHSERRLTGTVVENIQWRTAWVMIVPILCIVLLYFIKYYL